MTDAAWLSRLRACCQRVEADLLAERTNDGIWVGELSTSALSTATASFAFHLALQSQSNHVHAAKWRSLRDGGVAWLVDHQNDDGGWGDTVLSFSNISTTMLAHATLSARRSDGGPSGDQDSDSPIATAIKRAAAYIEDAGGVDAVIARYGKDRTFSVPILTHCALANTVDWNRVIPLPFELARIPAKWYATVRMPVVSYALPALIAMGQVIFHHRGHWNPVLRWLRRSSIQPSLKVLQSIQPSNGGFLEAAPLTSFVTMSLIGSERLNHPVARKGLDFLMASVREDGSWPIDTNLTTWVTTLSVNALSDAPRNQRDTAERTRPDGPLTDAHRQRIRSWLAAQQYRDVHPYTNSPPGGWSWTDLPGGVPDADDTPGAILATLNLRTEPDVTDSDRESVVAAIDWLLKLQNRDGGWPTFCRGWGTLPFDRSSNDLTAHVLRAFRMFLRRAAKEPLRQNKVLDATDRGLRFLHSTQRDDGTWLPLWFGNQHATNDENPLYGTGRVVVALGELLRDHAATCEPMVSRACAWLISQQNKDGGWSAQLDIESTVEETALAVEALAESIRSGAIDSSDARKALQRGLEWLMSQVDSGAWTQPSPIGFYFAKLWYFERLYPMIFATSALRRGLAVVELEDFALRT